jgi:hypothetical protein
LPRTTKKARDLLTRLEADEAADGEAADGDEALKF